MATRKRRMGPDDAATRTAFMDAAENVMREQGYAAISARNVAARAGLKYQLVFYYFETMDDLLASTYRRNAEKTLEKVEEALKAPRPLHALWTLWSDPFDGSVAIEFMAAANHNKAVRAEWLAFTERLTLALRRGLEQHTAAKSGASTLTPFALSSILASVGSTMSFAKAIRPGQSGAHTNALIESLLDELEPASERATSAKRKTAHT